MKKAIILAGGHGTRLEPLTQITSKQLLPIYNKPMIYYPLSICMLAGIRDIAIIVKKDEHKRFLSVLGNGEQFGIKITYLFQEKPEGLPHGIKLAEKFIGKDKFLFILGDNILVGHSLPEMIESSFKQDGATAFAYSVSNPKRFGVFGFDKKGNPNSIQEKPNKPKSSFASIGLYIFDSEAIKYFNKIKKSKRGEYEMPTLLTKYLDDKKLHVKKIGRGFVWFDAGTMESYFRASQTIRIMESTTNTLIGSPEEIALNNKWINKEDKLEEYKKRKSEYFAKLVEIIEDQY